jgi:hypothetical protein
MGTRWRHRVLRLSDEHGGHRLQVVALTGWRWLLSTVVHDACGLFGHPCSHWAPAHRVADWAFRFAEKDSQLLVSVPISTAEARCLFPDSNLL